MRAPQLKRHKPHKRKKPVERKTKRNCLFLSDSIKEQFASPSMDDDVHSADDDNSDSDRLTIGL